jgi:hypothetical protein
VEYLENPDHLEDCAVSLVTKNAPMGRVSSPGNEGLELTATYAFLNLHVLPNFSHCTQRG